MLRDPSQFLRDQYEVYHLFPQPHNFILHFKYYCLIKLFQIINIIILAPKLAASTKKQLKLSKNGDKLPPDWPKT